MVCGMRIGEGDEASQLRHLDLRLRAVDFCLASLPLIFRYLRCVESLLRLVGSAVS